MSDLRMPKFTYLFTVFFGSTTAGLALEEGEHGLALALSLLVLHGIAESHCAGALRRRNADHD